MKRYIRKMELHKQPKEFEIHYEVGLVEALTVGAAGYLIIKYFKKRNKK